MVDFSRSAAVLRMLLPNLSIVCPVYHRGVRSWLAFLQESTSEGVLASPVPQRWDRMHMLSVSPPTQETSLPSRKANTHHRHVFETQSPGSGTVREGHSTFRRWGLAGESGSLGEGLEAL